MATVSIKFRPSSVRDREGTLFFRIIHGRETKQIGVKCRLRQEEWDTLRSAIVVPEGTSDSRRSLLMALSDKLVSEKARLAEIIARLDRKGSEYTAAQVVQLFLNQSTTSEGFIAYAHRLVERLRSEGKNKAERYRNCVNRFAAFLGEDGDVPIDHVDAALMSRYEKWLLDNGLCANSTSNYMRNLRAIYNSAVEEGVTTQRQPFAKVYTGVAKTRKRAIPMSDFARIQALDLTDNPSLAFARDIFIFLFLTQGMSFCDMAHLKKTDIKDGMLVYKRKKTGQRICVKWQPSMAQIVDRYGKADSPYLLPIITDPAGDTRRQYKNALHLLNHKLKKLGKMAEIRIPLTSYVARHGWASNARNENVPIKTISQALGHESETTTIIYLTQIDTNDVDRANERLIRSFSKETDKQRKKLEKQSEKAKKVDADNQPKKRTAANGQLATQKKGIDRESSSGREVNGQNTVETQCDSLKIHNPQSSSNRETAQRSD